MKHINRILAFWLLLALGLFLAPAQSFAAPCEMGQEIAPARHACCVKKAACACEAPSQGVAQSADCPGASQAGCACAVHPQPVNSAPRSQPLRLYGIAALPTRAGPNIPFVTVPVPVASPEPVAFSRRFVSPSPPRAPPFYVMSLPTA